MSWNLSSDVVVDFDKVKRLIFFKHIAFVVCSASFVVLVLRPNMVPVEKVVDVAVAPKSCFPDNTGPI